MQAVILAGGFGSRLGEETQAKPKPMLEIGGRPILWHIMKVYSEHGVNDFVVCLGYKGYLIKEYFANYALHQSDVTFRMAENRLEIHRKQVEPWNVSLVDTGLDTMTGGRIKRIGSYLDGGTFFLTYGDGLSDINIQESLQHHRSSRRLCTITAVQPPGRFGMLRIGEADRISEFLEKPEGDGAWINGGFFVCEPRVLDYIEGDATVWEQDPLENLARAGELTAFMHHGFWRPMDTLRDKKYLEELWSKGDAPWKNWI